MMSLLIFKDKLREFCHKNDTILVPVGKFVLGLILFLSLNKLFGYSSMAGNIVIVVGLSLLCALFSQGFFAIVSGLVILLHLTSLSLDTALLFLILYVFLYVLCLRFTPNYGYIIVLTAALFLMKVPYLVPIVVGMTVGLPGVFAMVTGIVIYYFSLSAKEVSVLISTKTGDETFQPFSYIIMDLMENKEFFLTIITFCIVLAVFYFIYRMSMSYSWYIAIAAAIVVSILVFLIGGTFLDTEILIGSVLLGNIIAGLLAVVVQFFKGVVDYSRTELVQFEDDDYYYYIKAVPKIKVSEENINIKKIQARK
ncbi:MAG: hypothetical protein IJA32_02885 [Lachnospiraceae bacterium]|nr:hypothetical protein [Lachnospiraceae bacterium]